MSGVPDNLMQRLHEANEHFQQARSRADGSGSMNSAERGDVGQALRAAEKELEDVTHDINEFLAAKEKQNVKPDSSQKPAVQ